MQNQTQKTERLDPSPGAAVYSPWVLRVYDPMVLGCVALFSARA